MCQKGHKSFYRKNQTSEFRHTRYFPAGFYQTLFFRRFSWICCLEVHFRPCFPTADSHLAHSSLEWLLAQVFCPRVSDAFTRLSHIVHINLNCSVLAQDATHLKRHRDGSGSTLTRRSGEDETGFTSVQQTWWWKSVVKIWRHALQSWGWKQLRCI